MPNSNAVLLSGRGWLAVVAGFAAVLYLCPLLWARLERWRRPADYRLPYELSDDYWSFERWSAAASAKCPVLVVGDSVVWGQYGTPGQTLTHYLNLAQGTSAFANLGVDGLHPAAMSGLLRYYGKPIQNKGVVLHVNVLWMSSAKHDLRAKEEFRFNHPALVPQFWPRLACYRPSFSERVGIVAARCLPFVSLMKHVRAVDFTNMDLDNWTLENPYADPLPLLKTKMPAPDDAPRSAPVPWTESGTPEQDLRWVRLDSSFQWASFRQTVALLQARHNKVFALVGPFNTHLLTPGSRKRYGILKSALAKRLEETGVSHYVVPELPTEEYADASHPLSAGYARMAAELSKAAAFREWRADHK
ncbi:MAG: hypothetical protein COZ06_32860 [Armatimonadetes bacterium CG_4_10_14_3_um_filter_66_18]|nr:hypothetical protein [Armatimonadota bacterium]OIO95606.1 MAG: hypothetical protein AUJ96_26430 [Armatimonadetes bacterium CG2_30_66_41]PIU94992.1 MAG: hypothetical protein COS65_04775 [Armatimonadetes bacterium CG06_land_8_20_14_3_00_66_21]PIX49756.1 MAG: hypothetical protein COZ57_02380 [Armatimonadetes bacterium CG_4_8_14_3_um_filter_66_20]PIY37486.1 MAG: hypothetical protein COZ06_32860 [Armatimonadetes bacterium CG_4_10_14_3_um_filter_66_18]PIZ44678.1 MAG: hypothetical protein COY42_13